MEQAVLIFSHRGEANVGVVTGHLQALGQKFFRINADAFPTHTAMSAALIDGEIVLMGRDREFEISTSQIKSCWHRRPFVSREELGLHRGYARFISDEAQTMLWSVYTSLDKVFWMNSPLFGSRLVENNKLYQLHIAARVGLDVPATLVSNDAAKVIEFCEAHRGRIALKTLRGHVFSPAGDEKDLQFIYTQLVKVDYLRKHATRIGICPVFVQEYVAKKIELRITIVGNRIFACAIHSQNSERTRHDWRRYDFDRVKHETITLPSSVANQLFVLMRTLNLAFGAIDMIVTPDDRYVFLEINPSGQWGWIEHLTDMPISRAIAEVLIDPPTGCLQQSS